LNHPTKPECIRVNANSPEGYINNISIRMTNLQ
jgi:hypothetical protein